MIKLNKFLFKKEDISNLGLHPLKQTPLCPQLRVAGTSQKRHLHRLELLPVLTPALSLTGCMTVGKPLPVPQFPPLYEGKSYCLSLPGLCED